MHDGSEQLMENGNKVTEKAFVSFVVLVYVCMFGLISRSETFYADMMTTHSLFF